MKKAISIYEFYYAVSIGSTYWDLCRSSGLLSGENLLSGALSAKILGQACSLCDVLGRALGCWYSVRAFRSVPPYVTEAADPKNALDVFLVPHGCGSGPVHIAQDIAHELAHLTLGHYGSWYQKLKPAQEKLEHDKAREVEVTCGFKI